MNKEKVNKTKKKNKWHKNCKRQLPDLTYPPWGFNEYDNNTNNDKSNSNYIDNNNNNDKITIAILMIKIRILIMVIYIFVIVNNFLVSCST